MWITVDNKLINLDKVQFIIKQDNGCEIFFGSGNHYVFTDESFENLQGKILSAVSMYK